MRAILVALVPCDLELRSPLGARLACFALLVLSLVAPARASAQDCSVPAASRYPVAGPVNGGWDRTLEAQRAATYHCEGTYSNSDYIASGSSAHHGNDFFAAYQTPIVAVTDGVVAKAGWDAGLGYRVAIHDACGWEYDAGHLDQIADGIVVGARVRAGDVIGTMGSSGGRSGGVVHLHFNIHDAALAWSNDVDPFPVVGPLAGIACLPVGPRTPAYRAEVTAQSFPLAADPFVLTPGAQVPGFIEVRNTGTETWRPGEVNLGTSEPRDAASPLAGPDWLSPGRAATIDRVVAPGEVGRFVFTVRAPSAPGEYPQYFNLVRELVTWFSDGGGGPVDAYIQVRVTVVPEADVDGDGFGASSDCDDASALVHPGASEVCGDGIDQDCAGGDAACAAVDADGDGSAAPLDCDDTEASVHPGAMDACGDGVDADCDGRDACADGGLVPSADAGVVRGDGSMAPARSAASGGCSVGPAPGRALAWPALLLAAALVSRARRQARGRSRA